MKLSLSPQPIELTDKDGKTLLAIDLVEFETFLEKIELDYPAEQGAQRFTAVCDWIESKSDGAIKLGHTQALELCYAVRKEYNAFKKKLDERYELPGTAT